MSEINTVPSHIDTVDVEYAAALSKIEKYEAILTQLEELIEEAKKLPDLK